MASGLVYRPKNQFLNKKKKKQKMGYKSICNRVVAVDGSEMGR
jgi:hypothetical protein